MKFTVPFPHDLMKLVTTCVVVWIEIPYLSYSQQGPLVTTCVVVWIEIPHLLSQFHTHCRHHLRGGVD